MILVNKSYVQNGLLLGCCYPISFGSIPPGIRIRRQKVDVIRGITAWVYVYSGISTWDQAVLHLVTRNVGLGGTGPFGWEHVLLGMAGNQQSATGECHQFGHFIRMKDVGDAFFIFIGAPVIEVPFVIGWARLWQVLDRVDGGAGLCVAVTKGL